MATEIADAYIALYTKMPGVKKDIERELGDAAPAATKPGNQLGLNLLDGIGNVLKGGAIALGGIAIAGLGTALIKGFQRLDALDQAQAKLAGLGHSAQGVEDIMNDALASVKGTAFGMGDAATVAAATVAAGVKPGEELQRTLTLVADAATIAGVDMATMGSIVNKVATSDMMQMDVANQLMDAGIPILQMVGEQMGVTAEEAREMASAGEVSFETFQSALEAGLGGAALESGNTFSGAMDNVMAAMGRLGESLLGGAFENLKGSFGDLITVLDDLQPAFADIGEKVGEFAAVAIPALVDGLGTVVQWLIDAGTWVRDNSAWLGALAVTVGVLATAIGGYAIAMTAMNGSLKAWLLATKAGAAAQAVFNAVMAMNPIALVVLAIAALVAGLIWFFTQTELGQEIWANFTQFLGEAWDNVVAWVSGAIDGLVQFFTDAWTNISDGVTTAWTAISDFFVGIWDGIKAFFAGAIDFLLQLFLNWTIYGIIISNWEAISDFFKGIWDGIVGFFTGAFDKISSVLSKVRDTFRNVFNAIKGFIVGAFESAVGVIKGAINGIINLVNGAIRGLNNINVNIPDWVPLIGGRSFGVNLPTIPQLAEGGLIKARPGGIIANIGEGKYDEAVVPLSPEVLGQLKGDGGPQVVYNDYSVVHHPMAEPDSIRKGKNLQKIGANSEGLG